MKALIELKYIRDYHPEVVNRKLIDEAIAELEALDEYVLSLKHLTIELEMKIADYEEMIEWMEKNSNTSLNDYYNRSE